jgi:hypothetical protein
VTACPFNVSWTSDKDGVLGGVALFPEGDVQAVARDWPFTFQTARMFGGGATARVSNAAALLGPDGRAVADGRFGFRVFGDVHSAAAPKILGEGRRLYIQAQLGPLGTGGCGSYKVSTCSGGRASLTGANEGGSCGGEALLRCLSPLQLPGASS